MQDFLLGVSVTCIAVLIATAVYGKYTLDSHVRSLRSKISDVHDFADRIDDALIALEDEVDDIIDKVVDIENELARPRFDSEDEGDDPDPDGTEDLPVAVAPVNENVVATQRIRSQRVA